VKVSKKKIYKQAINQLMLKRMMMLASAIHP